MSKNRKGHKRCPRCNNHRALVRTSTGECMCTRCARYLRIPIKEPKRIVRHDIETVVVDNEKHWGPSLMSQLIKDPFVHALVAISSAKQLDEKVHALAQAVDVPLEVPIIINRNDE